MSPTSAPNRTRNAPTQLMADLHYGEGYVYAHDTQERIAAMQCLPDSLADRRYYEPTDQGNEARLAQRLAQIRAWREAHAPGRAPQD